MPIGQRTTNTTTAPRRRRVLAASSALCLFAALVFASLITASASNAASANRAGVVVDFGNGNVQRIGVTFTGSASGLQVLSSATPLQPIIRGFSGLGGAVCGIVPSPGQPHVGCQSDQNCLTCDAPRSWIYFRATAGSSGFTFSRAGAGSVSVRDGDIEGWRYGTGSTPPAFSDIESFFPPATSTTTASPTSTTSDSSTSTTRPSGTATTNTTSATIGSAGSTVPDNASTNTTNPSPTSVAGPAAALGAATSTSTVAGKRVVRGNSDGSVAGTPSEIEGSESGDRLSADGALPNGSATKSEADVPWPLITFGLLILVAIAAIVALRRRAAAELSGGVA